MKESEFQKMVLDLAKLLGWRRAHFRPARTGSGGWVTPVQGDGVGFPDLVLVRPPRMIVAELKAGKNKPNPEQVAWLNAFRGCNLEVYVWKFEDWDSIVTVLSPNQLDSARS
jgi:hypothetical protein